MEYLCTFYLSLYLSVLVCSLQPIFVFQILKSFSSSPLLSLCWIETIYGAAGSPAPFGRARNAHFAGQTLHIFLVGHIVRGSKVRSGLETVIVLELGKMIYRTAAPH